MRADAAQKIGECDPDGAPVRRGKVRLLSLEDLDGRTRAARATDQMLGDLIEDLGGERNCSTAERELAKRAAILSAMLADAECRWLSGERIQLTDYLPTLNAHRRVLTTLGLERRARDATPPSLRDYLAEKRRGEPAS